MAIRATGVADVAANRSRLPYGVRLKGWSLAGAILINLPGVCQGSS